MKIYVQKYRDFINEAYIDQSGELQDLDLNDISVMEAMSNLVNYLEDNGATSLTLEADGPIAKVTFRYAFRRLVIELDLDQDITTLFEARREAEPLVLLQLASDSFFDLLAVKGLDKIISSRI